MGLYREVGLPNRFAEIGLYLGNYRKTPFGVHVDGCGVFSFPIVGAKRFRIWKPSYAAKHPSLERSFHYAKHKAASKTLDAKVGDMTYWPSSAWHIAESNGSFSATWSLGVWVDQTHLSDVTKIVSDVIARHRHPLSMSGTTRFDGLNLASGEVRSLPKAYLDSLETLRKLSPANMRAEFMKAWLMHTSKQGLKPSPGNSRVSTDRKRAVIALRDSNSHVRWIFSKDDRCYYYSYNGVLTEGSTSKKFLKLIRALNNGAMFSKEQATKIRSALPAHDRMALRMLSDAGAFRSEATSQPL